MDRTRITSATRGSDGRLYSDGRLVVCHSADRDGIERELAEHGHADVYLGEPRGRGRPPLGDDARQSLTVRILPALRARVGARAEADGVSVTAVVEAALERYLG